MAFNQIMKYENTKMEEGLDVDKYLYMHDKCI